MLIGGMKQWAGALGLAGIGFYIAGTIILGILGGRWIDEKLNSGPIFLIAGLILGIIAAFYGVYRLIRPLLDNKGDNNNGGE